MISVSADDVMAEAYFPNGAVELSGTIDDHFKIVPKIWIDHNCGMSRKQPVNCQFDKLLNRNIWRKVLLHFFFSIGKIHIVFSLLLVKACYSVFFSDYQAFTSERKKKFLLYNLKYYFQKKVNYRIYPWELISNFFNLWGINFFLL